MTGSAPSDSSRETAPTATVIRDGAEREIAAGQRPVPERVEELVAEFVAQLENAVVRGATVGAGVAAVFDQLDRRVGRTEEVVGCGIGRPVEPAFRALREFAVQTHSSHARSSVRSGEGEAGAVIARHHPGFRVHAQWRDRQGRRASS